MEAQMQQMLSMLQTQALKQDQIVARLDLVETKMAGPSSSQAAGPEQESEQEQAGLPKRTLGHCGTAAAMIITTYTAHADQYDKKQEGVQREVR